MKIAITGARGFIGRNLSVRVGEIGPEAIEIRSDTLGAELQASLKRADFLFHLAGVNRPNHNDEFSSGNVGFTQAVCDALAATGRKVPIVYASSIQAELDNPYGRSKRGAEEVLLRHAERTGAPVRIFRLPNVFGKWGRPNYNSVVVTFCHNIARGLDIQVHDPSVALRIVHVDDVCSTLLAELDSQTEGVAFMDVRPVYATTVGEIAEEIRGFAESRRTLRIGPVGSGLTRALYSTYLSYLEPAAFAYDVPCHADARGAFVEMLKTPDCGQLSYFTAGPGITRGQHYHHTKSEKFLVLTGQARFAFRHILTSERHEIVTRGGEGRIVETVPGWAHDVTNIGETELVVMLWANEVFDRERPDTIARKV